MMPPSKVKRHKDVKHRHFEASNTSRGVAMTQACLDFVPANCNLKPTGLKMIVEPIDVVFSRYLIVKTGDAPMRGIVKAVGPGENLKKYDKPRRFDSAADMNAKQRSKFVYSNVFTKPSVQVGDIVNLGGYDIGGYKFQSFVWGDQLHLHCHENDVCFIEDSPRGA